MVRNLAILCLVASCLSAVALVEAEVASTEHLNYQKIILELFWRINQPHLFPEHYNLGKGYNIGANLAAYKNEEAVKEFLYMYETDRMPRGAIFALFHPEHLKQAKALFKLFYYAKDFNTLYSTAAWAKIFCNEGVYAYALSVALFHHPETRNFYVPPLHEMQPNLFFNDRVIRQAHNAKTYTHPESNGTSGVFTIPAYYSEYYSAYYQQLNWDDEYDLSYFAEDVYHNDLQYYAHIARPFWISTKEFPEIQKRHSGSYFFSYRLQYIAYYLARLSNGLGHVKNFDWNHPLEFGYNPSFSYSNGLPFPHRNPLASIPSHRYESVQETQRIEIMIISAIKMRAFICDNGTFIPLREQAGLAKLEDIVQGHADSNNLNFYGSYERLAMVNLGFSPEPLSKYEVFPSILEHYGINRRDPIYWSLVKTILSFYEKYMSKSPRYTMEELAFPGVNITDVHIDNITTFFAPHDYFITNAVNAYGPNDTAEIWARQPRLNHKPYACTMDVHSERNVTANIRMFLGPQFDEYHREIGIDENWKNFLPLNEFNYDLRVGTNTINCSKLGIDLTHDEVSGYALYKKVLNALNGTETYEIPTRRYGYPERMSIPKGSEEGYPFQFVFFIGPYDADNRYHDNSPLFGNRTFLDVPLGYPFDRPPFPKITELENVFSRNVDIYHINEPEINVTV